jgi:hypothetical protein
MYTYRIECWFCVKQIRQAIQCIFIINYAYGQQTGLNFMENIHSRRQTSIEKPK